MTTPTFQALIVDDEPISRKMMSFALTQEGFACDTAEDGDEASQICRRQQYDLVVTDLIMPNRNGHSLTVDLLAAKSPPIVIVHTSVDDPRITKDLLVRGVDDVVYKPTNYKTLAARAAVLVRRRREKPENVEGQKQAPTSSFSTMLRIEEIEERLAKLPQILPVSQAAFDVYNMTSSDEIQLSEIAAGIACDPSLSADVLRLANSGFCHNSSGKKIVDLEEAVLRVGQKRIGELALATSALSAVTINVLPWLNLELAWRRSLGAGVAVDLLLARGDYPGVGDGLFLSAIMHQLGRLSLGMLYPQQYQQMIEHCRHSLETLDELEARVFPLNTGQVMGCLFKAWNIPEAICEPLNYTSNSFLALAPLDEPLRTKVELLKLAIFIGQIAAGQWDSWDKIELPSTSVFKRLRITLLWKLIEDTRSGTQQIIEHQKQAAAAEGKVSPLQKTEIPAPQNAKQLNYCNLNCEAFDFLQEIIASMGITVNECRPEEIEPGQKLLVNCLWNPPLRVTENLPSDKAGGERLVVTDPNHAVFYRHLGKVLTLPISYGTLNTACSTIAQKVDPSSPQSATAKVTGKI